MGFIKDLLKRPGDKAVVPAPNLKSMKQKISIKSMDEQLDNRGESEKEEKQDK